jgi:hypothetical protein
MRELSINVLELCLTGLELAEKIVNLNSDYIDIVLDIGLYAWGGGGGVTSNKI